MLKNILISLGVVLSLGIAVWQFLETRKMEQALTDGFTRSAEEFRNFNSELGRANSRLDMTGELIEKLSKKIPEDIQRDLDERNAEIISIATAGFHSVSRGGGRTTVISRPVTNGTSSAIPDNHPKDSSKPSVVDGTREYEWTFSDWRLGATLTTECLNGVCVEGNFDYKLNQHFDLVEVAGNDGSHYIKLFELGPDGKPLGEPLKTEYFNVVERPGVVEKFHKWAPHLDIGIGGNMELQPQIEAGVSLMGYGKTENDLSWKVLRVGVEYDASNVGGILCPGSYNFGDPLPLVSNIWLTPCYVYDGVHGASISVGATL